MKSTPGGSSVDAIVVGDGTVVVASSRTRSGGGRRGRLFVYAALNGFEHRSRLFSRLHRLCEHGLVYRDAVVGARSENFNRGVSLLVHGGDVVQELLLGRIDARSRRLSTRR